MSDPDDRTAVRVLGHLPGGEQVLLYRCGGGGVLSVPVAYGLADAVGEVSGGDLLSVSIVETERGVDVADGEMIRSKVLDFVACPFDEGAFGQLSEEWAEGDGGVRVMKNVRDGRVAGDVVLAPDFSDDPTVPELRAGAKYTDSLLRTFDDGVDVPVGLEPSVTLVVAFTDRPYHAVYRFREGSEARADLYRYFRERVAAEEACRLLGAPSTDEIDRIWSGGERSSGADAGAGDARSEAGEFEFDWREGTGVSFDDVAAYDDVKRELERTVIGPLEDTETAERFDLSVPNVLFYGPPGTGKTHLAKALATEAGVPFVQLSGADVMTKWINESAERISTLFEEAHRQARDAGGAVIFLDELDAVLSQRNGGGSQHAEDRKVVNQFLLQLHEASDEHVVFVGATNQPELLDDAAVRAGRIDREFRIGLPDADARAAILRHHLESRPTALDDEAYRAFRERTAGMELSASDVAAVAEDATRHCVYQRDGDAVQWRDLEAGLREATSAPARGSGDGAEEFR